MTDVVPPILWIPLGFAALVLALAALSCVLLGLLLIVLRALERMRG